MKIYTRTGDEGMTALFGGKRVLKSDLRIDAYGTIDELNALIGMLRDQDVNRKRIRHLVEIQDRLFTIGSSLATEPGNTKVRIPLITPDDAKGLEILIDEMDALLPPMKSFILPGGHVSVSFGHLARTVCRRSERLIIALNNTEPVAPHIIPYVNRLSDYLFVLCRMMAQELGAVEEPWTPKFSA